LVNWADKWQLKFNKDKCKVMHIGGIWNEHARYTMMKSNSRTSTVLEEKSEEKDLGIWMSETLKASVSKGNQILGLIRRTFTYMDCELMKHCLHHWCDLTSNTEM